MRPKRKQKEILELKSTVTKLKSSQETFIAIFEKTEENNQQLVIGRSKLSELQKRKKSEEK